MDSPYTHQAASLPVAGWYHDPQNPQQLRYWDGSLWTDHYHPVPDVGPAAKRPPRRLRPFAIAAIAGLVCAFLVSIAALFVELGARDLVGGILAGEGVSFSQIESTNEKLHDRDVAVVVGVLVAAVAFLPWFFQAHANLRRTGVTGARHGNGWAVGAWFVPFLNLVRPKLIADDIYRGSQPEARAGTPLRSIRVAPLVHWWWAAYLLSGVVMAVGLSMLDSVEDETVTSLVQLEAALDKEHTGWTVLAASSAIEAIAAILAILFVVRVTAAQDGGAERPQPAIVTQPVQPVQPAPHVQPAQTVAAIAPTQPAGGSQSPPGWVDPYSR